MVNDKWLMFKNYMHNELGITKYDIQQWISDAVEDEVKRLVKQECMKFDINSTFIHAINQYIKDNIDSSYTFKEKLANKIIDNLVINYDNK